MNKFPSNNIKVGSVSSNPTKIIIQPTSYSSSSNGTKFYNINPRKYVLNFNAQGRTIRFNPSINEIKFSPAVNKFGLNPTKNQVNFSPSLYSIKFKPSSRAHISINEPLPDTPIYPITSSVRVDPKKYVIHISQKDISEQGQANNGYPYSLKYKQNQIFTPKIRFTKIENPASSAVSNIQITSPQVAETKVAASSQVRPSKVTKNNATIDTNLMKKVSNVRGYIDKVKQLDEKRATLSDQRHELLDKLKNDDQSASVGKVSFINKVHDNNSLNFKGSNSSLLNNSPYKSINSNLHSRGNRTLLNNSPYKSISSNLYSRGNSTLLHNSPYKSVGSGLQPSRNNSPYKSMSSNLHSRGNNTILNNSPYKSMSSNLHSRGNNTILNNSPYKSMSSNLHSRGNNTILNNSPYKTASSRYKTSGYRPLKKSRV